MRYKQLSSARTPDELREVTDDILDRYGPLPVETRNLTDILRLPAPMRQSRERSQLRSIPEFADDERGRPRRVGFGAPLRAA